MSLSRRRYGVGGQVRENWLLLRNSLLFLYSFTCITVIYGNESASRAGTFFQPRVPRRVRRPDTPRPSSRPAPVQLTGPCCSCNLKPFDHSVDVCLWSDGRPDAHLCSHLCSSTETRLRLWFAEGRGVRLVSPRCLRSTGGDAETRGVCFLRTLGCCLTHPAVNFDLCWVTCSSHL